MILDGFGLNEKHEANAVYEADTPNIDGLMKDYPFVRGYASGLSVGLPDGQMGNSEVGHLNMGAGRIVYQELTRISKEIEDGDFFKNEALLKGIQNVKENHSSLHLYGLLSDGGVHSHITHLYGLLALAKREGIEKVYVHCFLDGRDTSPTSGKGFMEALESKMQEIGVGQIATVMGRYYVMDRDNRWDRVETAYKALAYGEGKRAANAVEAVAASYAEDVTDEFVVPTVVEKDGKPVAAIEDKDTIIFFNFRPDRAREISRTFCMDEFDGFDRGPRKQVTYICFTEYDVTIPNKTVAFHKVELTNTFGQFLADHGKTQARIAETDSVVQTIIPGMEFKIEFTESEMQRDHGRSYSNRTSPLAYAALVNRVFTDNVVSREKQNFIKQCMADCNTGMERIAAPLAKHPEVSFAHRTGSGYVNERGEVIAVNDGGYVSLPSGRNYSIAVFVKDYAGDQEDAERLIACISETVYNHLAD